MANVERDAEWVRIQTELIEHVGKYTVEAAELIDAACKRDFPTMTPLHRMAVCAVVGKWLSHDSQKAHDHYSALQS
jgi:hypothetical protein